MNTIKYQEKQVAKVQIYILKGSMVWKLIFSVFCLLCVRVYADNTYFKPIPHYFKNTEIKDIIITQQCKDIALSPQQIKDFFALATKIPLYYLDAYFTSGCYIEGSIKFDNHKVAFSIDSLGVAWIDDNAMPRAIYVCEDEKCPIRAKQDDGLFESIPHYFKNTEIKDIIITQQCKDIALSPQQIKDFFALATKVPAFYRGSYMVENCYIQGFMRLNGRKVAFTIDSLGLAWLQDDIKPRAIYPCEDKRCPIRAEKDDGV
ncbi:hypothetical protein [Helicobacter trogontum]|uniref:hypothetical protein n=1 Tax=Helicobacter trogontum TaxID=50960 RepID=UPI0034E8D602